MKKLISLFAALLVAAGAMTVSSCATSHDAEPLVDLSSATICGSMEDWTGSALTDNKDGSWSYKFKAKGSQENFALRGDSSWSVAYRSSDGSNLLSGYELDKEVELVAFNSADCPALKGLVVGDEYTITVSPKSSSVVMKITHSGSNTPVFYVLDTTTGMNKMDYDGTVYTYNLTASGAEADLVVWSNDKYYSSEKSVTVGAETAIALTSTDAVASTKISGLENKKDYLVSVSVKDGEYSVSVAKKCPWFIVGGIKASNEFTRMSLTDNDGVFAYEFVFDAEMSGRWGSPAGAVDFVVTDGASSWNKFFYDTNLTLGADFVAAGSNTDNNVRATGLVAGKTYVITIKNSDGSLMGKIATK